MPRHHLRGHTLARDRYVLTEQRIGNAAVGGADRCAHTSGRGPRATDALYDLLVDAYATGPDIICRIEGQAASAASMVMAQGATTHVVTPHVRLIFHEPHQWSLGAYRISDVEEIPVQLRALEDQVFSILATRITTKSADEIPALFVRKEAWLSAEEALRWGLVDQVRQA